MRWVRLLLTVMLAFVMQSTTVWPQEWQNVLSKDAIPGWEPKGGATKDSWTVKDGVLTCTGKAEGRTGTLDDWGMAWIGTKADYTDFAIDFEFKLPPGGNSGVFLRTPKKGHPTFDGMEVQLLDNFSEEHKGILPEQQCGALYKIAPPSKQTTKPAGQWNHMRVTAVGDHIVVELNGEKIVDANGKSHPEILKRSPRGPVGLQNHGTQLEFRNIKLADLAKFASSSEATPSWLTIQKGVLVVRVNSDLTLNVDQGKGIPVWETARSSPPTIWVRPEKADEKQSPLQIRLADAAERTAGDYDDGTHHGQRIRLKAFPNTDVEVELIIALNDRGELLVQIAQAGGKDAVQRVSGLYDWDVEPAADTYLVVPRGSGYLIRSDSPQPVATTGFVGAAYSLPMFGIVRGNTTCYQIIETWWDAQVSIGHVPGQNTTLSLDWEASLGKLGYPRRVLFRFAEKMDHVGMAKAYRQYLIDRKELTTLRQQAERTPALKDFLAGIEYRWTGWEPAEYPQVLENIRHFKEAGLPVTFFFPKWPTHGYEPGRPPDAGWQGYLQPQPVPGGWPAVKQLADAAHQLGCTVKLMVVPYVHYGDAPGYDPAKASNVEFPALSSRYFEDALTRLLDQLKQNDFPCDALYFDGHSAYNGYSEHKDAKGPISRRQIFEAQNACFRLTRSRGIVAGAELARFWSVGNCSFFFFTDWASDRLREGEPIPLFPLVFHDCYGAHFSGGGYYDEGKYDWYADRNPRLYELMYAAMPSHNWLPGGSRPIRAEDWGTDAMNRRLAWLRRWHAYYQKVCYAEMLTHKFLNAEHTRQRIEFAGGVSAEFDLAKGLFRVQGVPGFSGDWEKGEEIGR